MDEAAKNALVAMALLLTLVVLKASVIAFATTFLYARPAFCEKVYAVYQQRPKRAMIIGTVNTLVLGFIGMALLNIQPLGLLGLVVLAGICAAHIVGRTAHYRRTAANLAPDGSASPGPTSIVQSGILTELSFLVPLVGQLLYLVVTTRCAGACFIALVTRSTPEIEDSGDSVE